MRNMSQLVSMRLSQINSQFLADSNRICLVWGWWIAICLSMFSMSCTTPSPNTDLQGENTLESLELDHEVDRAEMDYKDLVYVPIYSDIYVDPQNPNNLLSATLSIRNTSYSDSLFISKIDYFNTEGELVRSYIDNPISLLPMATLNYVIEKDDDTGGHGANFMVALSAKNKAVKPVIQAIMIGQFSNKSFAFSTDGYSVK